MANPLTTSLTVNFGDYEDKQLVLWEEDKELDAPEFHQRYVRLYPLGVPIRFATSGTLSNGVATYSLHDELLVFSGNDAIGLRYPDGYDVTFSLIGNFYNTNGTPTTVVFGFDASRNQVTASKQGYAAVAVRYKAKYTRHLFSFSGGPCPGLQVGPYAPPVPVSATSPYKESVLVALDPLREAVASLQMSPPDCESPTFMVNKGKEADRPRIDLMIDPNFPVRLTDSVRTSSTTLTVPYLASMTKLRLIPSVGTSVRVDVNEQGSSIVLEKTGLEQKVAERLLFSGSSSINLDFQAMGTIAARAVGVWRNKIGEAVTVQLRGPGDFVTEVERTPSGGYTNPRRRNVGQDELVACDGFGHPIEVFGVAEVSYVYDYDLYRLDLPYDFNSGRVKSVYVTALFEEAADEQQPATLFIEAPSLEGFR